MLDNPISEKIIVNLAVIFILLVIQAVIIGIAIAKLIEKGGNSTFKFLFYLILPAISFMFICYQMYLLIQPIVKGE